MGRLVLERRYLQRDADGGTIESVEGMFRRVADNVAEGERAYGGDVGETADRAYEAMSRLEFLPNSPTLMNAGLGIQQLAACFVLPIDDSLPGIFDALKYAALIHQSGGGTGFAFSRLRPANDPVQSTHGVASGPVSFMHVFDAATDAIKQGGTRRGANMAILNVDHPDIEAFIRAKENGDRLTNFNLSVAVSDAFMDAAVEGNDVALINPRNGEQVATRNATDLFALLSAQAWQHGDPGLVFLDRINRDNPTPALGVIESTNPCGEQPLLPNESCTLGSIDVSKYVNDEGDDIVWDRLADTINVAVRFLDNVIDQNRYPSAEIEQTTQRTRKIGLGIMGFADLLIACRVAYDSLAGLAWAERLMEFVRTHADTASEDLANKRGVFPSWDGSIFSGDGRRLRNATRTTIAPTGTLSIIAGCSSGIEPLFALAYQRQHYLDGDDPSRLAQFTEVSPSLRRAAESDGWWSDALRDHLEHGGTLQGWDPAPEWARKSFVTAHEIDASWHVRMQAAFQRHVDNAVSKTVNIAVSATPQDVEDAYRLAWREGCKGITVYRDQSRRAQVLSHIDVDPDVDWR
jgi:ribonucleoside-diphosphate reductase alpha chain